MKIVDHKTTRPARRSTATAMTPPATGSAPRSTPPRRATSIRPPSEHGGWHGAHSRCDWQHNRDWRYRPAIRVRGQRPDRAGQARRHRRDEPRLQRPQRAGAARRQDQYLHPVRQTGHWLGDYDNNCAALQQAIWLDDLPVGVLAKNSLRYVQPDHLAPRAR